MIGTVITLWPRIRLLINLYAPNQYTYANTVAEKSYSTLEKNYDIVSAQLSFTINILTIFLLFIFKITKYKSRMYNLAVIETG